MSQRIVHQPTHRQRPHVLALGDFAHHELCPSQMLIAESADVSPVATFDELAARLRESPGDYDLALIAQTRPGEWPHEFGDELQRVAPFTGAAMLLGSWCEGEERTGQPWTACERVFWYRFAPWWQQNLATWQTGRAPTWTGGTRSAPLAVDTLASMLVEAADFESADAMTGALAALGYTAEWSRHASLQSYVSPIVAGVWIGGQLTGDEPDSLRQFARRARQLGSEHIVALLDFPRWQSVEQAYELGATCVLGKPWRIEELAAVLVSESIELNRHDATTPRI